LSIRVVIQNASSAVALPARRGLRTWARSAAEAGGPAAEITLRIVDEAESRALNSRYRDKDRATNVLSFPFEDPPGVTTSVLGDVVICAPVVEREAHASGRPAQAHWAHMVIHGVLHLRGYDHERDEDAARMQAMESELLSGFEFSDPYAAADGSRAPVWSTAEQIARRQ